MNLHFTCTPRVVSGNLAKRSRCKERRCHSQSFLRCLVWLGRESRNDPCTQSKSPENAEGWAERATWGGMGGCVVTLRRGISTSIRRCGRRVYRDSRQSQDSIPTRTNISHPSPLMIPAKAAECPGCPGSKPTLSFPNNKSSCLLHGDMHKARYTESIQQMWVEWMTLYKCYGKSRA